jgi:cytoskeletal protein CcmA (bactofilin family)
MAVSNGLLSGVRNEIARMWKVKNVGMQPSIQPLNFKKSPISLVKESHPPEKTREDDTSVQRNREISQLSSVAKAEITRKGEPTLIGEHIVIEGTIKAGEDIVIEGSVKGFVLAKSHQVTVGKNGRVEADIQASSVSIHGAMTGALSAFNKVHLSCSARFNGQIKAGSISIEEGAFLKATIELDKSGKDGQQPARHVEAIVFDQDTPERKTPKPDTLKPIALK